MQESVTDGRGGVGCAGTRVAVALTHPRPIFLLPSSAHRPVDSRERGLPMSQIDRRSFFKIVAASGAAAAAAGCGQPPEKYFASVTPPEDVVPGVAAYFSTMCRECGIGCGVLAKNREGRVVKLEGNPDFPLNEGALCIRGQAGLQALYSPDRFRGPLVGGKAGHLERRAEGGVGQTRRPRQGQAGRQDRAS